MPSLNQVKTSISKLKSVLTTLMVILFVGVGLLSLHMSMQTEDMNGMICASGANSGGTSCMMNPGEHLNWWSHTFSQIPISQLGNLFLVLILALSIFGLLSYLEAPFRSLLKIFLGTSKDPPESSLFNYLYKYFAAGLAQPILYA